MGIESSARVALTQFLEVALKFVLFPPRPILMIHGGRDSYIRPDIASEFYESARDPKELWIVKGARHNACLETAGDEYGERVRRFFRQQLSGDPTI